MSKVMMKCGHVAQAVLTLVDGTKAPCCAVCIGILPEAVIVDEAPPEVSGRTAKCDECDRTTPSSLNLPFFRHEPDQPLDEYYCGCKGWN